MIRNDSDRSAFLERFKGSKPSSKPDFPNYKKIRAIGKGSFALVILYQHKSSGKYYACKRIEKENIVQSDLVHQIIVEKKVLCALDYPFVIQMEFSWKDNDFLYYFSPFVAGGDMWYLLEKNKKQFPEAVCRFFAAQLLLAINYLHDMNIIHRDIKPENVLIEANGYIKLADFGVCALYENKPLSLPCGTLDFMSPEMLESTGYGKSTDWWSYGVFIFEMAFGRSPFQGLPDDCFEASPTIIRCEYEIPKCSAELKNLISHLMIKDIKKRLGCNGIEKLMEHKWFQQIDWRELELQKIDAPLKPCVSGPGDTSNFNFITDIKVKPSTSCLYEKEFAEA